MHMCICDRYWQIRYSVSKTWIHRIQYFVSAAGVGGRGCTQTVSSQLIGSRKLKVPPPPTTLGPSILSPATLPSPIFKTFLLRLWLYMHVKLDWKEAYRKRRGALFVARRSSGMPWSRHRCSLISVSFNFHSDRKKKANLDSLLTYHALVRMQTYV